MLTLRDEQIVAAEAPSNARAIAALATQIADQVGAVAPDIPAVLTRLNVRLFLASLAQHGIGDIGVLSVLAKRYFAAGKMMVANPYATRWRNVLIAREMTSDAKEKQLSHLLTQAETALGV